MQAYTKGSKMHYPELKTWRPFRNIYGAFKISEIRVLKLDF